MEMQNSEHLGVGRMTARSRPGTKHVHSGWFQFLHFHRPKWTGKLMGKCASESATLLVPSAEPIEMKDSDNRGVARTMVRGRPGRQIAHSG